MKKTFAAYLIFGWFFAMQADFDENGIKITSTIGGYKSERACKAGLDEVKEIIKMVGRDDVKFMPCYYVQES